VPIERILTLPEQQQ